MGDIEVGQLYRDARNSNIRTLRVDSIGEDKIVCTVIRQEYAGEITTPMRETTMTRTRLTGRDFVLLDSAADAIRRGDARDEHA